MSGKGKQTRADQTAPSKTAVQGKTQEQIWKEREKRLEELLEKDHGPNPKSKEDFDRLLEEMVRRNSR